MSANEIHAGDIGTVFTVSIKDSDTAVNLSGVTSKYFLLKKPSGSITTVTANFVGSGTSGVINFTSTSAHFDTTGIYKLQAKIVNSTSGVSWTTDVYEFFVYPNLE